MATQGLMIQVPGIAVPKTGDAPLPKFYPEDGMLQAGTLAMFDLSNSAGSISAVPANGSTIPNIAWKTAQALVGSGTQSSLAFSIQNFLSSAQGIMEITGKKGLHGIVSQVNDTAYVNFIMKLPTAIANYIITNSESHQFYFSLWGRNTRLGTTNSSVKAALATDEAGFGPGGNYEMLFEVTQTSPTTSNGKRVGGRDLPSSVNTLGNFYRNIAASGWTGTKPSAGAPSQIVKFGPNWGYAGLELHKCESWILYKLVIEDLTVSGRTYAQADASDKQLYDAAFATGGRFDGDTFTSPSTLA